MITLLKSFFLLLIIGAYNSHFIFSQCIKNKNDVRWDYQMFSIQNNLVFSEIKTESIFDINDSLSSNVIFKILNDKDFLSRNINMTFYNSEYTNDSLLLLNRAGLFSFKEDTFYYFFHLNMYYDCFECVNFLTLYRSDHNNDKIVNIPIGYQAADTPYCFGDFNNDDILDFLCWDYTKDVHFYNLIDDRFILNEKIFITLNIPEPGLYFVNKRKSCWIKNTNGNPMIEKKPFKKKSNIPAN